MSYSGVTLELTETKLQDPDVPALDATGSALVEVYPGYRFPRDASAAAVGRGFLVETAVLKVRNPRRQRAYQTDYQLRSRIVAQCEVSSTAT